MPTWSDLFAQRSGLLVNGWTANHDYSADLVAAHPAWGTGAGGDVIQFLIPTSFSDIFAGECLAGFLTNSSEPDWASVPNIADTILDGGVRWFNCGPLTGFEPILPWAQQLYPAGSTTYAPPDHGGLSALTPSTPNGHIYIAYPILGAAIDETGQTEETFPTDGSYVNSSDGRGYWLDMGEFRFSFTFTRVSVAFDSGPLDAFPTWTPLDATDNLITGHTITRGRTDTFDRTGTGTASIGFADSQGILDPTNTSGPYYNSGNFIDGKQAAIALQNPVTGEWSTIFRGLIDDVPQDIDISQRASFGEIQLVDGLDYLAGCVLRPGVDGDTPPHEGDVYYAPVTIETAKFRIDQVLTDFDWPAELRDVFTMNVQLQGHTYAPGTPALNVIDDACDAEFPGIANRYISKEGVFSAKGRFARFRALTDPQYNIQQWKAGDGAAIEGDSSYAQIRSLTFGRPRSALINSALFTPQGVADSDIATGHVEDATSIDDYGRYSKEAQDLLILHDNFTGNNAIDECHEFASFWVASRKDPKTRISQISFKSLHPDDERAGPTWRLMCGVELNDIIILKTGTVQQLDGTWVGGFDDVMHFVEGIQYTILPLTPEYDNVTLTLQLTPLSDFVWEPWE